MAGEITAQQYNTGDIPAIRAALAEPPRGAQGQKVITAEQRKAEYAADEIAEDVQETKSASFASSRGQDWEWRETDHL